MKFKKEEFFSIPNIMGYLRILLIPVFCYFYFRKDGSGHIAAIIVLLISSVTDLLDGVVARRFNMVTELGKFIDPFADKLTHAAIAVCLCFQYPMMKYLLILMIIKEGFMSAQGIINLRHGKKLDGAMWFGKICTAYLFIILLILLIFTDIPSGVSAVLIVSAMIVMVITLLMYIPVFRKMNK